MLVLRDGLSASQQRWHLEVQSRDRAMESVGDKVGELGGWNWLSRCSEVG